MFILYTKNSVKTYLWIQNKGWISVIITMNKGEQTVPEVQKGGRA